jgi:hypothetical protein
MCGAVPPLQHKVLVVRFFVKYGANLVFLFLFTIITSSDCWPVMLNDILCEFGNMRMETILASFEVLNRHRPEEIEKNYERHEASLSSG